jgi:hypothetical protein
VDTFEYLAVLISIVVGLGLTHVLSAMGRVISSPANEKLFWVHSLWTLFILVYLVFWWWFELGLRDVGEWTGSVYAFVVLYAIALYLLSVVIVPAEPQADYREYYFSRRKWIFGFTLLAFYLDGVDSYIKPAIEDLPNAGMRVFVQAAVPTVLLGIGLFTKKTWYHGTVAALLLTLFLLALLFRPIPG